jgi:cell division protein FtsB
MKKLSHYFQRVKPFLKNKYIIIILVFGVYFAFFDSFNLSTRFSNGRKIDKLENDITYYENEIESCKRQKEELQSNNKNLEKFAREEYLMKNKDEDIYIVNEK